MDDEPPVDSILIVSFGGPNYPDEVLPFLRNVTAGRNVPDERLLEVAEHYLALGGRSPINEQNLALADALRNDLQDHGIDLPVYWGNRNWHPFLTDTVREMMRDERRHAVAFVTSAFSSYSGCRQYREDIDRALHHAQATNMRINKIRQFFNHPGFIEPMIDNTRDALSQVPKDARLIFTAHSIPLSMARASRYERQLREACMLVTHSLGSSNQWDLVYQSRSGPPQVPWLGPDVNDHLRAIRQIGVSSAVLIPIGFVSDHMEVIHDLDNEATRTARSLGLSVARTKTVGTDTRFVSMIRELVMEHVEPDRVRQALGSLGVVGCLGKTCCIST